MIGLFETHFLKDIPAEAHLYGIPCGYYKKHGIRNIGEYMAVLIKADCIVFTAGAGQKSSLLPKEILTDLYNIGIEMDDAKNATNPVEGLISTHNSPVKIAVIPTIEEYIVAKK